MQTTAATPNIRSNRSQRYAPIASVESTTAQIAFCVPKRGRQA